MSNKKRNDKHYIMQSDVMEILEKRDRAKYPTETDYIHAAVRALDLEIKRSSLENKIDLLCRHFGLEEEVAAVEDYQYELDDSYGYGGQVKL